MTELELVLSHTEKACMTSYYRQYSKNNKTIKSPPLFFILLSTVWCI